MTRCIWPIVLGVVAAAAAGADNATCLLYVARNIQKDASANAFSYFAFSKQKLEVRAGDLLEYDLLVGSSNPQGSGGIEAWSGGGHANDVRLRDVKGAFDQHGAGAHPAGEIKDARGQWYSRKIGLDALAGKTLDHWLVSLEGDRPGLYVVAVDNVRVHRADGSVVTLYDDGEPAEREFMYSNGYDKPPALLVAGRQQVAKAGDKLAELAGQQLERQGKIAGLDLEAGFITLWLKSSPDGGVAGSKLAAVQQRLASLRNDPAISQEQFGQSADLLRGELAELALAGGRATLAQAERAAIQPAHLTIDLATDEGQAAWRATGFLHGFSSDLPADELVKPLKIKLFRARWFTDHGIEASYERAKSLGAKSMVVLSCEIHDRGVKPWPGERGDWSDWENRVEKLASTSVKNTWEMQYDIWNEPDGGQFWGPGLKTPEGRGRWLETYRRGVAVVRRVDPKGTVVAPSLSSFDMAFMKEFLTYAKEHNCLPDVVSWHFTVNTDSAAKLRAWMKDNGIAIDRLSLNEYAPPEIEFKPGPLVMQFATLERMKVESASKSCWPDDGGDNGETKTLNGLLTWPQRQPRSAWWAYKAYADVEGRLLKVARKGAIDGVAAADEKSKAVRAVIGLAHGGGAGPHVVRLVNLDKAPWLVKDGDVGVKAQWIPDTGQAPLLRPIVALDLPVPVGANELTVTLPYVRNSDAYFVEFSAPK